MNNFLNRDITTFSRSKLVKSDGRALAERLFHSGLDPVLPLIAQGLVEPECFFSRLAGLYRLPFRLTLPTPLSARNTLMLRIPLSRALKHNVYIFEEHGTVWCAAPTPFITQTIRDEILSFVGADDMSMVIAPCVEIRRACAHVYHYDASITATDRMEVVHPESSSRLFRNFLFPYIFPGGFFAALMVWAFIDLQSALFVIFLALNSIYGVLNPYKIYVFFRSFNPTKLITITAEHVRALRDDELPVYTVLVPVKNEANMIPQLVRNIMRIDYPPEKLDIKFVCEVTDRDTLAALENEGVGRVKDWANPMNVVVDLVKVPVDKLSTKPRSCNYAAQFARGDYLVIFDAEDRPDPDQLKKAILSFRASPLDTVCTQARLNFYNTHYNTLTRLFSLEYSFWYDFFLPGSHEMNSAITLGGTSNHFVTAYLKKIGYWDPYNVTEDADLGLRIFRYKLHTTVFTSYTLEEANSELGNWLHQRTRWQKGFLMTLLVNMRHPVQSVHDIGWSRYLQSLATVASNFLLPLFNPILWLLLIASYIPWLTWFSLSVPSLALRSLGYFNLIVGNATYVIVNAIVVIKKKQWRLLPYIPLLPAYWLLLSVACWRALWQFLFDPYRWEKTRHGLTKK